jgi:hypothetical protein
VRQGEKDVKLRSLSALCLTTTLLVSTPAIAAPRYSDWSNPVPVTAVNTADFEFPNTISRDGLSLYFQRGSTTPETEDLYVVHRATRESAWGSPIKLPSTVNSPIANDRGAFISTDGHWLYWSSTRSGGRGGFDLYVSFRQHVHDDGDWQAAVNLSGLNTTGFDSGPALFTNEDTGETELYFVSNPGAGGQAFADIYVSVQNPDGTWGTPTIVTELSSVASEGRPYLRRDGLEIYFQSNRAGTSGPFDIWVSTRAMTGDVWSAPANVAEVNTTGVDVTPVLTWDGLGLFIGSTRADVGNVFYYTREKDHGKP